MNKEFESYITRNYYTLLKISKKMTLNNTLASDLLHEILLQILEKGEIKLDSYDDNTIKYYIVSIMRINWFSKTSPFYYKIKRFDHKTTSIDNISSDFLNTTSDQESFEKQQLFDILEEEFSELDWFRKSLFELYLTLGSYKKVSIHQNQPLVKVHREITKAKKEIKEQIINKLWKKD
jgi:hypothetical protein